MYWKNREPRQDLKGYVLEKCGLRWDLEGHVLEI